MNPWLLIAVTTAVLYGLWLLLDFTFTQIENFHAARREERYRASEPRNTGAELAGERDG